MHNTECAIYAIYPKLAKTPLGSCMQDCRHTSCREFTVKMILFGMKRLLCQAQLVLQTGNCSLCICLPLLLSALKPSHRSALPTTNFNFLVLFPKILLSFLILRIFYTNFCGMPTHRALGSSSSFADTGCSWFLQNASGYTGFRV